jgi:hypothetical protein
MCNRLRSDEEIDKIGRELGLDSMVITGRSHKATAIELNPLSLEPWRR